MKKNLLIYIYIFNLHPFEVYNMLQKISWIQHCLNGIMCCFKTWMFPLALIMPSQICKLPMPCALTHANLITDTGFWALCLWYWAWFPKTFLNKESSVHSTCLLFRSAWTQRSFWLMLMNGTALTCNCICCNKRFYEVFWADVIMSFIQYCQFLLQTAWGLCRFFCFDNIIDGEFFLFIQSFLNIKCFLQRTSP